MLKEAENKTCDLRAVFTSCWCFCVLALFHVFVAVGNAQFQAYNGVSSGLARGGECGRSSSGGQEEMGNLAGVGEERPRRGWSGWQVTSLPCRILP